MKKMFGCLALVCTAALAQAQSEVELRSVLKFSPVSIFYGKFPISVEFPMNEMVSLEGGLMPTGRDFFSFPFLLEPEQQPNPFLRENINSESKLHLDNVRTSVGFGGFGEFRVYPEAYHEEWFLGIHGSLRRHVHSADFVNSSGTYVYATGKNISYNVKELKFVLGYSGYLSSNDKFYWESSVGFGYRAFSAPKYPVATFPNGVSLDPEFVEKYTASTRPFMGLSVKIGLVL